MERIDDAVRRILKMRFELNLFERPYENPANYPLFGSQEFRKAAYETAVESMTLLKNENNILPLSGNKKILVTGPNANSMRSLNGGWSYSWLGDKTEQYAGEYNTILEAVRKNAGEKNVIYSPGVAWVEKWLS